MDEKIRDVAELRKQNPYATLVELAEIYHNEKGISVSKSGMKHRFVKIHDLAEQMRKDHES